jgi:hypothetical protein
MRKMMAICPNSRPSRGFVLLAGAEPAIRRRGPSGAASLSVIGLGFGTRAHRRRSVLERSLWPGPFEAHTTVSSVALLNLLANERL